MNEPHDILAEIRHCAICGKPDAAANLDIRIERRLLWSRERNWPVWEHHHCRARKYAAGLQT